MNNSRLHERYGRSRNHRSAGRPGPQRPRFRTRVESWQARRSGQCAAGRESSRFRAGFGLCRTKKSALRHRVRQTKHRSGRRYERAQIPSDTDRLEISRCASQACELYSESDEGFEFVYSFSLPPPESPTRFIKSMRGRNIAMTMLPTTTARKTIMIGSSNEVIAATALSTSSS